MATAELQGNAQEMVEESILDKAIANTALDRELAVMRMENETMMSECRMHPRDMGAIKKGLASLLTNFPEFADDAIYSKSVGKEKFYENGKEVWKDKFAEDLSVRAAEALAEAYGFNRIRAEASPIDSDSVKVEATFTDYQSGRVWQDSGIVSKWYTAARSKGGGRVRYDEDRFHNTVVKAAKSKVIREVILRSVNPALKAWFKNECYKVMEQSLKPDATNKIVEAWNRIGVNLEQLEALVGKPRTMGWMVSDQMRLRTLFVAVRDGEETIDSLLGKQMPEPVSQEQIDKELADKTAKKPGSKGKQQTFTPAEEAAIIQQEKGDAHEG